MSSNPTHLDSKELKDYLADFQNSSSDDAIDYAVEYVQEYAKKYADSIIEAGQTPIDEWKSHVFDMEALAIDHLVMAGKANSEQLRIRNNHVTDRRAILLSSGILKVQKMENETLGGK